MKSFIVPAIIALAAPLALAKLPPPDDAAKAKAAEAAARTAWQGKVEAFQLCKSQDKVAAHYRKSAGKAAAVPAQDVKAVAAPAAAGATAAAGAPPAPCMDPGPFAYNPPAQKPLEASGAHSPTGTAAGAPSVAQPAAQLQSPPQPAKKP